jgi:hypothetical protein
MFMPKPIVFKHIFIIEINTKFEIRRTKKVQLCGLDFTLIKTKPEFGFANN